MDQRLDYACYPFAIANVLCSWLLRAPGRAELGFSRYPQLPSRFRQMECYLTIVMHVPQSLQLAFEPKQRRPSIQQGVLSGSCWLEHLHPAQRLCSARLEHAQ